MIKDKWMEADATSAFFVNIYLNKLKFNLFTKKKKKLF